jgi:hypothetical protein
MWSLMQGKMIAARWIAAGVLAMCPGLAWAAPPVTGSTTANATGSATATVLSPIVVTHNAGAALAFGSFTAGSGGTVIVSPAGARSATGGAALVLGSPGGADAFVVEGDPNRGFAVVTGAGTVSFGGASMAFTTLPSLTTGTLSAAGAGAFTVGGTLSVPATAAAGSYAGSYSVTVNYN